MKKLVILALALSLTAAFAFSACGGKNPAPTVTPSVSVSTAPECQHDFQRMFEVIGSLENGKQKVLYECSLCEEQEYRWEDVAPSVEPSVEATVIPSAEETVTPSQEPSVEPTVEETLEPTVEESVEPSTAPSVEISVEPSIEVSVEPSVEVSVEPSVTPSVEEEKATIVLANEETGETESISALAGEAIGALPTPVVENKDFVGWYDSATRKVKLCETDTFGEGETATYVAIFVEKNGIVFNGDIVYSAVASVNGAVATITAQGAYMVSGASTDGQIVVNAPASIVQLTLTDVTLTCTTSAPIYVEDADKVIVFIPAGTQTELKDTNRNGEKPRGVLHSKDDMNILGYGTLKIIGNNYSAIRCGADLSIEETTLIANTRDHAISADGEMELNAKITVVATYGDGIRTEYVNSAKEKKGNLIITGGTYDITSANGDAFDIAKNVTISGGTVKATAGNYKQAAPTADSTGNVPSRKGVKANGSLFITGGSLTVYANDDGINLGGNAEDVSGAIVALTGNLEMTGGTLTVTAGGDGVNASGSASVTNATLTITAGNAVNNKDFVKQRGIKAGTDVILTKATVTVIAKSDGINAENNVTVSGGKLVVESTTDEGVQAVAIVFTDMANVVCRAKSINKCLKYTTLDTSKVGSYSLETATYVFE